jgi:hypothetical protein
MNHKDNDMKDIELGKLVWEEARRRSGSSFDLNILGEFVKSLFKTPFQDEVKPWLETCFSKEIASNKIERNHRFFEESTELVQSLNCTREEAHQLVDYVYDRPVGEPNQEVGGVMITLAALCLANNLNMHDAGFEELARVWTKIDVIREKQKLKPKNSPLPEDNFSNIVKLKGSLKDYNLNEYGDN